jgi:hypothetical protein
MAQVNDPNGPNHEYWYIQSTTNSSTLRIEQETVINQYIKQNGPPPSARWPNFYNYNNGRCINSADFVRAVMGHENSGVGPGATGHYGLIVGALSNPNNDPRTAIEDNTATDTEGMAQLEQRTTNDLARIDVTLHLAGDPNEQVVGGNWSAQNKFAFWSTARQSYSGCVVGRDF